MTNETINDEIGDLDEETARSIERSAEDQTYVPVIIKRIDAVSRHPDDTLEKAIKEGFEQHERTKSSLLLSSVAAGLILGFVGMSVAVVSSALPVEMDGLLKRIITATVYPLGFIVCVLSGTQLFTEHTATALYPVLDGKVSKRSLFQLWSIVLIGNLIGTFISSVLVYLADPIIASGDGFLMILDHLLHYKFLEVFISAVLAGWLIAEGSWLVIATPPSSAQILCIYIVTFMIGLGGLHHSIAGSAELFSGLFHSENPDYFASASFLTSAVLGNLVGGSVFVGLLNFGHIKQTQKEENGK